MLRIVANTLAWLSIAAIALSSPVEAARFFKPDQTTFLKGVEPNSTSTATLPSGSSFKFFADNTSDMKTDIAGTTSVTTAGDTVGKWLDTSGNSYHVAAAADDGTRPLYQVRSGKGYVAGDGTDDILYSTTAPNLFGSGGGNNFTVCIAYRWTSPAGGKSVVDEADAASTNTIGSYIRSLSATPANMSSSMRGSDGSTNIVPAATNFYSSANDGADHVLCYVRVGTVLTPYLDGAAGSTVAVTSTGYVANQINLFGRYRGRTSGSPSKDAYAGIDLYGVVAWTSDQTSNISTIYTVMRALYP